MTGDEFRDLVRDLLVAAGFRNVQSERQLAGKRADIYAERDGDFSVRRYAFETKHFTSTLPLAEVTEFVNDYSRLTRNGSVDEVILISSGEITASGREAVSAESQTRCFTYAEFQRSLFGPNAYLSKLVDEYAESAIETYYVPTRTDKGLLEEEVDRWLLEPGCQPLVVLGGYGTGKSTFAQRLASRLAEKSLGNPAARIPIRIALGNLVQQNNLEGLFGEYFTAKYNVVSPAWNLLRQLNRQGRFVIIFDGFDEMKHGMTFHDFERQFDQLVTLAAGEAKILILGRDTALRDEREFRSIIGGRRLTQSGTDYRVVGRPECRTISIAPFSVPDAHAFVEAYFEHLVEIEAPAADRTWIADRLSTLRSKEFEELIARPVHAQMLCKLATDASKRLFAAEEFSLYDAFVDYLLLRETEKIGRYERFDIGVRRKANAALSWWLLSGSGGTSTTLRDAPAALFIDAVGAIPHNFSEPELVAEMSAGCLVSKGIDTIYFGHRSIQEFLGAEHVFTTGYRPTVSTGHPTAEICAAASDRVVDYLDGFFSRSDQRQRVADQAVGQLAAYRGPLNLDYLGPYVIAAEYASPAFIKGNGNCNIVWLRWVSDFGSVEAPFDDRAIEAMSAAVRSARDPEAVAALAFVVGCAGQSIAESSSLDATSLVSAFVRVEALTFAAKQARGGRKIATINSDEDLLSYLANGAFQTALVDDEIHVVFDTSKLGQLSLEFLKTTPILDGRPQFDLKKGKIMVPRQRLLAACRGHSGGPLTPKEREELVWYFEPRNRQRIRSVNVTRNALGPLGKSRPSVDAKRSQRRP